MRTGWFSYLRVACLATIAFGAVLVLLPAVTESVFGWLILRPDGFDGYAADEIAYVRLVHAVLGAVMIGWFTTMLLLLPSLERGEPGAWRALVVGFLAWCVLDLWASIVAGFWGNVLLNLVFAVAFLPALWATRPVRVPSQG